jgi:hypothetical protein
MKKLMNACTLKRFCFYLILILSIASSNTNAQNFWQLLPNNTPIIGKKNIHPNVFTIWKLDNSSFENFQIGIPLESDKAYKELYLPTPEGTLELYKVYENPVMMPLLQAKYSNIRTYTAINVNDEGIMAKLDYTPFGFHAMVMDYDQTYFIDPVNDYENSIYQLYNKNDLSKPLNDRMQCHQDDELPNNTGSIKLEDDVNLNNLQTKQFKTHGTLKREYRLALACTAEYANAVGGTSPTKTSVLAKMVTSVNRVSGVYEKEFATQLKLINNTDTLIYLNTTTDGFTNNSSNSLLNENENKCNTIIGLANYDIGHVFSTGGGGLASLGCVCNNNKARGVTGSTNPQGDAYDIDYVAHEMGHQFGANHTFDALTGSCSGNRSGSSAYEVGSGSTIMGYAGICGTNDLQNNSDDYFSIRSLNAISTFMENTGTCAVQTVLSNTPPSLPRINKTYYIPYLTFFEVNQAATDAQSNPITYCWEQYDRANNGMNWDAKTTRNPLFRSFKPKTVNDRVFPRISSCVANVYSVIGERVPDTNRTLRLQLAVRDVNNGYGSFNISDDSIKINVVKTSTLFRVTSQLGNPTYTGYDDVTVTWDKAGTDTDPNIATSKVDIYLSVDGGLTYPYGKLGLNNTGTAIVNIANVATTAARFKVKAANNIYFDLNDQNFTIIKKNVPTNINTDNLNGINISPNPATNLVQINNVKENTTITLLNINGTAVQQVNTNYDFNMDVSILPKGIYQLVLQNESGNKVVKKLAIQ